MNNIEQILELIMSSDNIIASVITLMFAENGVKDNTYLMRCHILGLELERIEHTIESIKNTSAYKGCVYDISFNDDFLQKLLDKASELKKIIHK